MTVPGEGGATRTERGLEARGERLEAERQPVSIYLETKKKTTIYCRTGASTSIPKGAPGGHPGSYGSDSKDAATTNVGGSWSFELILPSPPPLRHTVRQC